MKNKVGIRREDLSKKGEKRVALVPSAVEKIVQNGTEVIVQPAANPVTEEKKRAFNDSAYIAAGATVSEDLKAASPIVGLKEIETQYLLPEKAYLFFSHTHKGQLKNRDMLRKLIDGKNTLIDYELVTNDQKQRIITAFTYFAGYALSLIHI